jgi:hypothetical protein
MLVRHRDGEPPHAVVGFDCGAHPCGERPAAPDEAALAVEWFLVGAAGHGDRELGGAPQRHRRQGDLPLHGLVPAEHPLSGHGQRGDRPVPAVLHLARLQLKEPQMNGDRPVRSG